jgi:hypothetical protein
MYLANGPNNYIYLFAATGYSVYKNFRYKQEVKSLRREQQISGGDE